MANLMQYDTVVKKTKYHIVVEKEKLEEVVDFYKNVLGAAEIGSRLARSRPVNRYVELQVANTIIVVSTTEDGDTSRSSGSIVETVDLNAAIVNAVASGARKEDEEFKIFGGKKITDPWGFSWAVSEYFPPKMPTPSQLCGFITLEHGVFKCADSQSLQWAKIYNNIVLSREQNNLMGELDERMSVLQRLHDKAHSRNSFKELYDVPYFAHGSLGDLVNMMKRMISVLRWALIVCALNPILNDKFIGYVAIGEVIKLRPYTSAVDKYDLLRQCLPRIDIAQGEWMNPILQVEEAAKSLWHLLTHVNGGICLARGYELRRHVVPDQWDKNMTDALTKEIAYWRSLGANEPAVE